MTQVPGFDDPNAVVEMDQDDEPKGKRGKKTGGGFQTMGLSFNVLKGITKRGYKIPTPIQRKTIPLVLEGRDVVAMARTGSGKTACFLIPLFEKLKTRTAKSGARAIILSPTRELAIQTNRFIKELGRFTGLKSSVILGGDSMDDQFSALHGSPDIIVATPGRFLHVCVEMDLKLSSVEFIVFDEADRLFEMGFGEQLNEIINRLPDGRQTLLFSATLPKVLVEFAKAGLNDPVLIRLDVESKIPDNLQLWYFTVRPEEKTAALLVLLKEKVGRDEQTVVFAATKHHVEYLHMVLDQVGISNTYIYSNLDPYARKLHSEKFSQGKVKVLVVTDVAARGIDIPQLDNVVNYNFPAKAKLFVHRVGRCARAGRSGTAYSLVGPDEYAHLLDLHLFLGRQISISTLENKHNATTGRLPQSLLEEEQNTLITLHANHADLVSMFKVTENAYQQYIRSRPVASSDSNRKAKEIPFTSCAIHPIFADCVNENDRETILDKMKVYRPAGTVFEICGKNKSQDYIIMKEKRALHKDVIAAFHQKQEFNEKQKEMVSKAQEQTVKLPECDSAEIEDAFREVVLPKKRKIEDLYRQKNKKLKTIAKDEEHFIPYTPADKHTEDGLAVNNFQQEANKAQLDICGDSQEMFQKAKQQKVWDRKKKKLVTVNPNSKVGKIKTESGAWIPATFKSNRYEKWMEKTKTGAQNNDSDDEDEANNHNSHMLKKLKTAPNTHWARHNQKLAMKQKKSELKTPDQILKARKIAEKKKQRQKGKGKGKGRRGGKGGGGRRR